MSAELNELAGRVEALSGPDREIDRDIMLLAVPCDRAPFRYWMPVNENTGHGAVDVTRVYYGPHCAQAVAVPEFTASIDAAMTLAPEGLRLMLSEWDDEKHLRPRGPWQAVLSKPGADASFDLMRGYRCEHGATPAIALTAAALRARSKAASQ